MFFKTATTVLLVLLGSRALAEGAGGAALFGIIGGYSVPDSENTNPHQLFGVKGSANVAGGLGLGGYYAVSGPSEGSGAGVKYDFSLHGAELNYVVGGGSGVTYLGFRVGLTKVNTTQSGVDVMFSPYHYGFVIGHDYSIWGPLSVGFEGSYLRIETSSTTTGGTVYQIDKSNIMSFLLALTVRL